MINIIRKKRLEGIIPASILPANENGKINFKFLEKHVKAMLCGHFIGIDKLERLKLLQSVSFSKTEQGREPAELFTRLNNWEKDRRFVVLRVLKPEQDRTQLSLIKGDENEYFDL